MRARPCWIGPPLPGPHPLESRRWAAEWEQRWRREHSTDVTVVDSYLDQYDLLDRTPLDTELDLD